MRKAGKESSRQTARISSLGVVKPTSLQIILGFSLFFTKCIVLRNFEQTSKHNLPEPFVSNKGELTNQNPFLFTYNC